MVNKRNWLEYVNSSCIPLQSPCFSSAVVPQAPSVGNGFSFPSWFCSDGSLDSVISHETCHSTLC